MPASDLAVTHTFNGGLATDFGAVADLGDAPSRAMQVPFLVRADNLFYRQNGAIRKINGINKYNSVTIESGEEIRGEFEYVKLGTGGSPTRKKVVVAGTKYLADGNDGTFVAFQTSMQDDSVPCFCVFNDVLIISTDNTSDVPKKWDQTTAADLGGSPPRFSFAVNHANRVWAAGNFAVPSRLYYSDVLDHEDWAGGGSIDIDPDDGDMITAIYVFRGSLIVFKGPNFGSIHVISGLTPSTFERTVLLRGVGAIWQNLVFPLPNDVGFMALDGTIRTISATQKFGDLELGQLSQPVNTWLQDNVALRYARKGWAATDFTRGYVLFTLPIGADTKPTTIMMMDYRFQPARFAMWPCTTAWSVARMTDPSNSDKPILYLGGNDGFVRKTQQATLGLDGVAIAMYARTPGYQYGTPNRVKTIAHIGVGLRLTGEVTMRYSVRPDRGDTSDYDIDAGAGTPLGSFVLGTDTLSGDAYITKWQDTLGTGEFRQVSYEISNTALSDQVTVEAFYAQFEQSADPNYE